MFNAIYDKICHLDDIKIVIENIRRKYSRLLLILRGVEEHDKKRKSMMMI